MAECVLTGSEEVGRGLLFHLLLDGRLFRDDRVAVECEGLV